MPSHTLMYYQPWLDFCGLKSQTSLLETVFVSNANIQNKQIPTAKQLFHGIDLVSTTMLGRILSHPRITDGHYKLIINLFDSDEWYDLASDPDEIENRILDENQAKSPALAQRSDILDVDNHDPLRGPQWSDRPWAGALGEALASSGCGYQTTQGRIQLGSCTRQRVKSLRQRA